MKKREEEKARAEGSTAGEAEASTSGGQGGEMPMDTVSVSVANPPVPSQDVTPDASMEVDSSGASAHEPSVPQPVAEKPRSVSFLHSHIAVTGLIDRTPSARTRCVVVL